jgi:spore germination protein GerM
MARKKKGSPWTIIIVAVITFAAGVAFMLKYGGRLLPPSAPVPSATATSELKLYFGSGDGRHLGVERRLIKEPSSQAVAIRIKRSVEALIEGPVGRLSPTIPDGTAVIDVRVSGRTARIDFNRSFVKNHPGGSTGELHTIYSIVNTVVLNFPGIDKVQILIEGKVVDTLAGHIAIDRPLTADKKLIKG